MFNKLTFPRPTDKLPTFVLVASRLASLLLTQQKVIDFFQEKIQSILNFFLTDGLKIQHV